MRVAYFVFNLDGMGGTSRSVISQANALTQAGHDVSVISATRSGDAPQYELLPGVDVDYLVDIREPDEPRPVKAGLVSDDVSRRLHARASLIVPARWDSQFTALLDVACEDYLPRVKTDVVVAVTPGLLATAIQLLPERPAVVHQEHRSSSDRTSGLEALLSFAPRADLVALLTPSVAEWLRAELGSNTPELVVMPNPLPIGFKPRSTLRNPVIVAAGRLVAEKQFSRLIEAFAQISDQIPGWRLRIFGEGAERVSLVQQIRMSGLYDRVELPGTSTDMPSEWARASISALTSRAEGLPLVVQEAMAAGVPVAGFDCPSGPREVIEHGINGLLVSPDSIAGMASALLRLATDDDFRARLAAGALSSSRQYAPDVIASRWIEIFDATLKRRNDSSPGRLRRRIAELNSRTTTVPGFEPVVPTEMTPAAARTRALSWAVDAVEGGSPWFVMPPHGTASPTVVVPMPDRDRFLEALGRPGAPPELSLVDSARHRWPERRSTLRELTADLRSGRTARVTIEPWPEVNGVPTVLGQGCSVDVEFWEVAPNGDLVAPGLNGYTSSVPRDIRTVPIEVEGVSVQTLPLMSTPTVDDCRFPIDVVYTWVDGNDPVWGEAREERLGRLTGTARTRESSGGARFVSRDELRYSMRSLHLFAPWVRRIFVVTAGQVPSWLAEHPKVRLVDHTEILPADALPTFNSHAIETALHRIAGLAEHWVYFNDDVLLGRPIRPQAFFTPAGHPAVYFSGHPLGLSDLPDSPPYLMAGWNNRRLLEDAFGATLTHTLAHTPHAQRSSVLTEIEQRFPEDLGRTARAPFRSETDISLLSSLAQHYGLLTGRASVGTCEHAFVNLAGAELTRHFKGLLQREQDFFCLGDHHDHALNPAQLSELLGDFLENYFPVAAPWERIA
jgi:glycosyltransferase involved in cell wall biosynthesis